MVDQDLLERVIRLDDVARRELRDAIDRSLPAEVTPKLAALLDALIADADAHPEQRVPWETIRGRTRAKIAEAKKRA